MKRQFKNQVFDNKKVWITGASSGIGLELAKQLSNLGASIILSARNESVLNQIRKGLVGGETRHWVFPLDLAQPEDVYERSLAFTKALGGVDILINNGGISQRSSFLETDLSVFRQLSDINYLGSVALSKAVLPSMLESKSGTIVSVSSVAGKVGSKLRAGYSGSKFAVIGFMDCLRAEVKSEGVHCLTVCPGSIKTNISFNALNGQGESQNVNDQSTENGMEVSDCVQQIILAITMKKDEVVIGKGLSALAPTIKRFFPRYFNHLTAKLEYR